MDRVFTTAVFDNYSSSTFLVLQTGDGLYCLAVLAATTAVNYIRIGRWIVVTRLHS